VTVPVITLFEVIDVDHDERERTALTQRSRMLSLESDIELTAILQARQRIARRQLGEDAILVSSGSLLREQRQ